MGACLRHQKAKSNPDSKATREVPLQEETCNPMYKPSTHIKIQEFINLDQDDGVPLELRGLRKKPPKITVDDTSGVESGAVTPSIEREASMETIHTVHAVREKQTIDTTAKNSPKSASTRHTGNKVNPCDVKPLLI